MRRRARVGQAAGAVLLHPVQTNEVFVRLCVSRRRPLREAGFECYDLGEESASHACFAVS